MAALTTCSPSSSPPWQIQDQTSNPISPPPNILLPLPQNDSPPFSDHNNIHEPEPEEEESAQPNFTLISYVENPNPNDPSSHLEVSSYPSLLHLSFNQDHGCFAVGTDNGFRIFNCDPFREIFRRDFGRGGGIGVVEMLFRCNILAIVGGGGGGGLNLQYPLNKVMIWDDHQNRCIGELSFRSDVKAVRLRRDRVVVVLEHKIMVYNFADLKLLHQIETRLNPKGLCEVSQGSGSFVLVCPGLQKGQVRVEHYGSKRTKFIVAHDSRIACFALTQDGQIVATCSSKGTLVRIFNTLDGTLLQEVRRGADRAEIYSLAFSPTAQWLAVSSDKGTVHVFGLKVNSAMERNEKPHSSSESNISASLSLSFIKGDILYFGTRTATGIAICYACLFICSRVLPKYFSSEWSVAQFRLHEGSQYIVAFGHQKNTIVILGLDGSFYRCEFNPESGGEMIQLEYYNFLKPQETF
ncbi:hypothetical protein IFM89_018152 [Coptis chinensis]|uniref:Uncharacterized protein n=1 Tax=Coptis chinensis TaxID=261450 RepID=A0A835M021_9MAGN|nr:hypothetical protein IFM89_018152 [Coptis chinensis]